MLLNCGVGEDSGDSLGVQGDRPVHPKGNQSWIFIERTDAKTETLILWPLNVRNRFIGKDLDAWKDWRREEKGMTEDEIVGWHHQTQWTWVWVNSGSWDGQGSLVCCSPWGCKESDTTEQLNWTEFTESLERLKSQEESGQEPREPGQTRPEWSNSGLKSHLEGMSGLVLDRTPWPHVTEDAAVSPAMATGWTTLLSLPVSSRIKAWSGHPTGRPQVHAFALAAIGQGRASLWKSNFPTVEITQPPTKNHT